MDHDLFTGEFVEVYRKDTGEKQTVPARWMDHPTLSKPFRKTPKTRSSDNQTPASGDNTKENS